MLKNIRNENGIHVISLTQRCNNFCVMCYEPHLFQNHPSFEELKEQILSLKNPQEIYLSGGEPTIRNDLAEIILFIKKTFPSIKVNLITNGRMFFYKDFTKKIKKTKIDRIITEIHGSNAEIHDSITQVKGSFHQTIEGINNIISEGLNLELRIVINKLNYKDLENIAVFICDNFKNISNVVFFPINIWGNAYKNLDKVVNTFTDAKQYLESALDILDSKFNIKLFHYPFCVIDKKYWKFVQGVTTDTNRLMFVDSCDSCIMKNKCPMIWKTYVVNIGEKEFKPI
jgi:His-Xaa-Ser system radical SAM maturase HxsC